MISSPSLSVRAGLPARREREKMGINEEEEEGFLWEEGEEKTKHADII